MQQQILLKNKEGQTRNVKQLQNVVMVNGRPYMALSFDEVINTLRKEGFE